MIHVLSPFRSIAARRIPSSARSDSTLALSNIDENGNIIAHIMKSHNI